MLEKSALADGAASPKSHHAGTITALRLDWEGRIADATEEAARLVGMSPAEMQGLTLGDLVADQWRAMADSATARILCGENRAFQLLLRGKNNRQMLVQMASRRVNRHERPSYVLEWSEHPTPISSRHADGDITELRGLAGGLLHAQETERTRVAMKLDNGVAPLVVVAKFMIEDSLQRLAGAAPAESVELLKGASDRLRQALAELQNVATGLRPRMLDDLGLVPTIEWHCRRFEQTNRAVRINQQLSVSDMDVPEHLKLVIFRLVEEALANVAQHSNASEAHVVMLGVANELLLWVQDNGDGFEALPLGDGARPLRGIGLACIQKRIEATGGRFVLQSSKSNGTKVGATWPLPQRAMNA
jgi:two-component system NarL family sensor kinase